MIYTYYMKQRRLFRTLFLVTLCGAILLMACSSDGSTDDLSVSEITIYNIPKDIVVDGSQPEVSNPVYKVYLNASDYREADKPPKTQGFIKVTPSMLVNDKYTVTIALRKPIINLSGSNNYDPTIDPNEDLGPWKGTANNFSLMISPKEINVGDGENAIWVKGGMTLNKSKASINWESVSDILDFRSPALAGLNLAEKTKALYDDLISRDPDITKN